VAKLLAISILVVPLLLALRAARARDPRRGLRRTVSFNLAFGVVYVLAIIFLYFRMQ
jgi:hypothetical protein